MIPFFRNISQRGTVFFLAFIFILSASLKIWNIKIGAPYTTIDDHTAFEGGFMVWFGNAPPQRMYLESWISGISSICTYLWKLIVGGEIGRAGLNLVPDAYRDFYLAPDSYVQTYRVVILIFDLLTAWIVYKTARTVLKNQWEGWSAVFVTGFYLFSYNTFWCDIVARPDTLMTFFGALGFWVYLRSLGGERTSVLYLAGAALGVAAGLKLHGVFFVLFATLDLFRIHGWRKAWPMVLPFVMISVLFFSLAAGSLLFDPAKYLKLRLLNIRDDVSPWIQWGDQFIAILKGGGWLAPPLVLVAAWGTLHRGFLHRNSPVHSVVFQAFCWLALFATIRQLRPYWMLPALPLFYLCVFIAVDFLKRMRFTWVLVPAVMGLLFWQSIGQVMEFRNVDYGGLRRWVVENVEPNEKIYIFGYEALELPKNTECIRLTRLGMERTLALDYTNGLSYMERHIKRWEEHSRLELFDMLDQNCERGYSYYSHYRTPLSEFRGIVELKDMHYIMLQERFPWEDEPGLLDLLTEEFSHSAEVTGPGGGGSGLSYQIFTRRID